MSEVILRDSCDLSEAEYLAIIEVSKIWQYKTYHSGGVCTKSDLEDWLTKHFGITRYTGHIIANKLTETYDPRTMDFNLAALAGLHSHTWTAAEINDELVKALDGLVSAVHYDLRHADDEDEGKSWRALEMIKSALEISKHALKKASGGEE